MFEKLDNSGKLSIKASDDTHKNDARTYTEQSYGEDFSQLSKKQRLEELYSQIDTSAEIIIRLVRYVREISQELWDLPPEEIYKQLTNIAFPTADQREIEKRYKQNQRNGFRLSITKFIEDLREIKPYRDAIALNPKKVMSELLDTEFEGQVEVETLPVGFVVYVDEIDYEKFDQSFKSAGQTLYWTSLPTELIGKVIVINKGGKERGRKTQEKVRHTREHELRHIIFFSFFDNSKLPTYNDFEENLVQFKYLENHQEYAEMLRKNLLKDAQDEVIAYYSSGDISYKKLLSLDGNKWLRYLEKVKNYLWTRTDMRPEEKALIYDIYQKQFVVYLNQIKEYQWVAQKLFTTAQKNETDLSSLAFRKRLQAIHDTQIDISYEESLARAQQELKNVLTTEKAEALLQNTPIGKTRRLGRYFGIEAKDIPKKRQTELRQSIKKFFVTINTLTAVRKDTLPLGEDPSSWPDDLRVDDLEQVMLQYPLETLPAILKALEGVNDSSIVENCLYAVEIILNVHHHHMATTTLMDIRSNITNMLIKRTTNDFNTATILAQKLLKTIDQEYIYGGVDFIHYPPIALEIAKIINIEDNKEPSVNQLNQLVDLLKNQDSDTWAKYLPASYFKILSSQPLGLSVLIKIGNTTPYPYFAGGVIDEISANFAHLSPDQKAEINTMLSHILSTPYNTSSNILERLRSDAQKLKARLKQITS